MINIDYMEKGEEVGFYKLSGGVTAIEIKNSGRAGVYVYNREEKNWNKDESLSEKFKEGAVEGKYNPFLPAGLGSEMRMHAFLWSFERIFGVENSGYYGFVGSNNGFEWNIDPKDVPASLPQTWKELINAYVTPAYGYMLEYCNTLLIQSGFEPYKDLLQNMDIDEISERADELNYGECAACLLMLFRAGMRSGTSFFFQRWNDGSLLQIIRRMKGLLLAGLIYEENPAAEKMDLQAADTKQKSTGNTMAQAAETAAVCDTFAESVKTEISASGSDHMDCNEKVTERLIRYAKVDTQSRANVPEVPTTAKQFDLARMLRDEMTSIGVENVWLDEKNCVVYGELASNLPGGAGIAVGYITHMDTSPDAPGANVKPWLLRNYDGEDILLNAEQGIVLKKSDYLFMKNYIGQDLVLTDGTTLLGGDDKAAIAAVMTFAEYLAANPQIKHGPIKIAFTPDEEVGGLACNLDLERFGADIAYTIDGDHAGYYSYETFNAVEAQISIEGLNVHPGTAKGIMVNAIEIGARFISMLPDLERPQHTEGREGFYHPHGFSGNVEHAQVLCLIRDHDENRFEERKEYIRKCVRELNRMYGDGRVKLTFANGYYSMKKAVEKVPFMIENLTRAISECGLEPVDLAFRGGTDGSAISQRGLPCPNLSAGYENGHSRFEFVSVQTMSKNVEILLKLTEIMAEETGSSTEKTAE